jgi:hypothetical protein
MLGCTSMAIPCSSEGLPAMREDSFLEATELEGDGTAEHEAEAPMTDGAVVAEWAPTSVYCRPSPGGWSVREEAEEQHVGAIDAIDHAQTLYVSACSIACQWRSGRPSKIRNMIEHWRALLSLQHSFDADARSCTKLKILILKPAMELISVLTGARVFFCWLACDIIKF